MVSRPGRPGVLVHDYEEVISLLVRHPSFNASQVSAVGAAMPADLKEEMAFPFVTS